MRLKIISTPKNHPVFLVLQFPLQQRIKKNNTLPEHVQILPDSEESSFEVPNSTYPSNQGSHLPNYQSFNQLKPKSTSVNTQTSSFLEKRPSLQIKKSKKRNQNPKTGTGISKPQQRHVGRNAESVDFKPTQYPPPKGTARKNPNNPSQIPNVESVSTSDDE